MMKHGSAFCAGFWPFLIIPSLLWIPTTAYHWHKIEQKVAKNAQQALGAEHDWASAETINLGRDVLLVGTAPNQSSVASAIKLAEQGDGVRSVEFVGKLADTAPAEPPSLSIARNDQTLQLTGLVNSQTTVDELLAEASKLFPQLRVENKLSFDNNVTVLPDDLLKLSASLPDQIGVNFRKGNLTLSGNATNAEQQQEIMSLASKSFAGPINSDIIVEVANDECEHLLNDMLRAAKINFETGKATIKASSNNLINQVANIANRCPDATFEVAGHTDARGNAEENIQLSRERAQAVVNRLVARGLKANRFSVQGYGSQHPIANNNTEAGRAANRRIEFKLKN